MTKCKYVSAYTEKRWALVVNLGDYWVFVGRRCWWDAKESEPKIQTFRTRSEARLAKKKLSSYRNEARVVAVEVTTRKPI